MNAPFSFTQLFRQVSGLCMGVNQARVIDVIDEVFGEAAWRGISFSLRYPTQRVL